MKLPFTAVILTTAALAGEHPYFVTYSHDMEDLGDLEVAVKSVTARPQGGNRFSGNAFELEYGVNAWWTSELYLTAQSTRNESSFLTGYRWESRFRLLPRETWLNPVLYVEYASMNGADRSVLEVVGHDGAADMAEPTAGARLERKREIEAKLIVGNDVKGWNLCGNFIAEKVLAPAPVEFGYAVGVSRPLVRPSRSAPCELCKHDLRAGIELYGGLGTHRSFGLRDTSHYVAPGFSFRLGAGTTIRVSPAFGLTPTSAGFLLRFGVSHEFEQFGSAIRSAFRRRG